MPSFLLSAALLHPPAAAAVPLHGDAEDDYFGASVSDAGDVDGDGYDDLLVGAPAWDIGPGEVRLYLGGPSGPSIVPALILVGDPLLAGPYGTEYGDTVSGAGDVNADGFDDVAIAAGGDGVVYVHHGSASGLSATPATTFGGWGFLGTRLADAGDVNGDGFDDLLVAAVGDGHYQVSGRAFVHLGSAAGIDPVPVVTWTGGEDFFLGTDDYRVGDSVAGAGDVDGDGYDDVLVTVAHGLHLYAGSPSGPGPLPAAVWNDPAGSVAEVGGTDVNGDGYSDVVLASSANGGVVRTFFGSAAGAATSPSRSLRVPGVSTLSRAGDVNGDGYGDVVAGAPMADDERGRVEILVGGTHGLRRHPWSVVHGGSYFTGDYDQGERLGSSVSTALDLNGDGFDDVVAGGPLADANIGQALVTTGHPDLTLVVTELSVSGGVSVDVRHAPIGVPITVRIHLPDDPAARQTRVIGEGYANSLGELHVEGSLPGGVAAGTAVTLSAGGAQEVSGWTVTERSEQVPAVVTP